MESKQQGLVPNQDGRHGLARMTGATVYYVDNDSEFIYSHFQTSWDLDQTIASKQAFEAIAFCESKSIFGFQAGYG